MIDLEHEIPVTKDHDVWLKVEVNGKKAFFSCSMDGLHYIDLPSAGDVSILSDEQATPQGFTGAFVGMACQDSEEQKIFADFISFSYVRGNE